MKKKGAPTAGTETINMRVKRVREALSMTQMAFSRVLALSSGYLAGIETERRAVNDRLVKLVCSSFCVNETWLHTGTGPMFAEGEDEFFIKLASLFRELNPKYREYLFKEITLLLEMQDREDS
jgi:transcriptional regulator with XRE-family HTH domain